MLYRYYILLNFSLLFLNFCFAQNNSAITEQKIDSIVKQYMSTYRITGLSVGIVKDGKAFLTKGYGFTEINTNNAHDFL